jgi:hypothetical protein
MRARERTEHAFDFRDVVGLVDTRPRGRLVGAQRGLQRKSILGLALPCIALPCLALPCTDAYANILDRCPSRNKSGKQHAGPSPRSSRTCRQWKLLLTWVAPFRGVRWRLCKGWQKPGAAVSKCTGRAAATEGGCAPARQQDAAIHDAITCSHVSHTVARHSRRNIRSRMAPAAPGATSRPPCNTFMVRGESSRASGDGANTPTRALGGRLQCQWRAECT